MTRDQGLESHHDTLTLRYGCIGPRGKRFLGIGNGIIEFGGRGLRNDREGSVGSWIQDGVVRRWIERGCGLTCNAVCISRNFCILVHKPFLIVVVLRNSGEGPFAVDNVSTTCPFRSSQGCSGEGSSNHFFVLGKT